MEKQALPDDFKEFLKLLNEFEVKYLLIDGYAVGFHGYPRTTADMDIGVAVSHDNELSRSNSIFIAHRASQDSSQRIALFACIFL
jgi:hypothetical protein